MTENERQQLTAQGEKLDEIHAFFFSSDLSRRPTRAAEIDTALAAIRAGKVTTRALMWFSGLVISVMALVGAIKGWWPK